MTHVDALGIRKFFLESINNISEVPVQGGVVGDRTGQGVSVRS